jgi:rieske iron-sulfur protein
MTRRRTVLKAGIGLSMGLSLGTGPAARQEEAAASRPRTGDWLVRADDPGLAPLAPGDIPLATRPTFAWAMDPADRTVRNGSRLNRLLLLRFDADALSAETQSRSADGVLAYSTICPHTGCDVIDWLADERLLHCPCHFSKFDPRDAARVVDGPAPRPLPALPLSVVEGRLVVARPFLTRVGFEVA